MTETETPPRTPSLHFDWDEFGCHDYMHTPYPVDIRIDRGVRLANELERLRALLSSRLHRDCPLWLDSVYRTLAHNTFVCGRPRSQHLAGRAADVRCPYGCTYGMFRNAIDVVAAEPDSLIRYVCCYPNQGFAHLDIRPTSRLVVEEA